VDEADEEAELSEGRAEVTVGRAEVTEPELPQIEIFKRY
jgi:hypothetical protein